MKTIKISHTQKAGNMEDLSIKILKHKIDEKVSFINRQATRQFDKNIDLISISLSERQFFVIQKHFNIHKVISIYGVEYRGEVGVESLKCDKIRYNDRKSCYELLFKDIVYIEDEEEREEYLDILFR